MARGVELLRSWALRVELAKHVFDRHGSFVAGSDQDRLTDLNDALRDPEVRAVFTTRGGKGSYRLVHGIDFDAVRKDPKPLVGFSDITYLHLALYGRCGLATIHGPGVEWEDEYVGPTAAYSFYQALFSSESSVVAQDPANPSVSLTRTGLASGVLVGGTLPPVTRSVGWALPDLGGAVLLLEAVDLQPGAIDAGLTQLLEAGAFQGPAGIAVGQFIRSAPPASGKWSYLVVRL